MADASLATTLILVSAFFHASWNAILKSGEDRDALIGILNVVAAGFAIPLVWFVPFPSANDWIWISVSVLVHLCYQLSLARMMGSADYSLVYPISRGLGPLIVTLVSISFLAVPLNDLEILAILVLIGGAMLAGFASAGRLHAPPAAALLWAGLVGLLIGTYTVIDGSAVKRMEPLVFILWSNILIMPPMMALLYRNHGKGFSSRMQKNWKRGLAMTIVAYGGYTMALYAFSLGNLAEIAALRETSIFFAAIIGTYILREKITPLRLCGISMIAVGAVLLKTT